MIFRWLTDTRMAAAILIAALAAIYVGLPLAVDSLFLPNPYFVQLAQISAVSCVAIAAGYWLPLFDRRFRAGVPRLWIESTGFHTLVWSTFGIFLVITLATADAIPLISAFQGVGAGDLAQQRGDFLKTRSGAEAALIYISTLFVSALLPYSLALLFIEKSRFRFLLLGLFLAYSLSFLQKALFLNVLFPLLYLAARGRSGSALRVLGLIGSCLVLLVVITQLAFGGSDGPASGVTNAANTDYFAATYLPGGTVEHLVWRSTAVPMFSASDTLVVHDEQFGRQPLWGATSSFFAGLFGLERINLERLVSEHQWGWSDIANTNSVYITEAWVNFGWIGIVLFSVFVGQALRWFRHSTDEAFKALWPIFCFAIFTSGLIGTLLSNGYALIFGIALFARIGKRRRASRPTAPLTDRALERS